MKRKVSVILACAGMVVRDRYRRLTNMKEGNMAFS
jgi:hypothetical protein